MTEMNLNTNNDKALEKEVTRSTENYLSPAVDIFETEDALTLVADMPGVERENLKIGVEKGLLTIEVTMNKTVGGVETYTEFDVPGYYRQFRLSDQIDATRAEAQLDDGVLTLSLPKSEAAKPRKIAVKTVH